jgi:squalene-hopene/tetraprenyl-beta-curcumene cyclase
MNLQQRFEELSAILLKEMNPKGFWEGELSSSALGVAVSVAALHFHDRGAHQREIRHGLDWLQKQVNPDGSFGDTPESPGNVSTSLLVYAAANLYSSKDNNTALLQGKIAAYLSLQGIDVHSPQVAKAILGHYKKDYTFSVPILTMCGLCGVPGRETFKHVPQLPFELSLLPRKFYRMLNLSVVSYAIPALIAVGIVVFNKKKSNAFGRFVRKYSIRPALALLQRLLPESGGFLEAIPLTAFVCLSLVEAGYRDQEVVEKGIAFLKKAQREDGSWPIDVDLSSWVTTLAVKALGEKKDEVLSKELQSKIAGHLLSIQNKGIHPFNGSQPGGWGWTNHSGSVPDGDDTPGVVLALFQLQPKEKIKQPVLAACDWLVQLQNSDGGFPTFSKGWGKLPFDQSCADLTGHGLLAISACLENFGAELNPASSKKYWRSFHKALQYLQKHQRADGSWLPLWFGNQQMPDHTNPVYGTAKVLSYLHDALLHRWSDSEIKTELVKLTGSGEQFLLSVQNEDGSWGGEKNIPGTMEETALAVAALSTGKYNEACLKGMDWLDGLYRKNGLKASPIGLYFASLWYDEKMYPLTAYLDAVARMMHILGQQTKQI